ncbi:hypothetical protein JVV71_22230, partial [Vibrio cholerae O1]|nr:hypothetical protein [Vibrio cholerae O1]
NFAIVLNSGGVEDGGMSFKHCLLAASVAVMWGLNFLAIDLSLEQFPPFFLVAFRFALLAIPPSSSCRCRR